MSGGFSREWYTAESLPSQTTGSNTTYITAVTLTFQPKPNTAYVIFWAATGAGGTSSNLIQDTQFYDVLNATELVLQVTSAHSATPAEVRDFGGMYFLDAVVNPAVRSFAIRYRQHGAASGDLANLNNSRIVALELTASDAYGSDTSRATTTNTSGSAVTKLTTSVTAPTGGGSYAIFGTYNLDISVQDAGGACEMAVDGTVIYFLTAAGSAPAHKIRSFSDAAERHCGFFMHKASLTAGSHSTILKYFTGTGTVGIEHARILYLRLDDGVFGENFFAQQASCTVDSLAVTSTFTDRVVSTQTYAGGTYLMFAFGFLQIGGFFNGSTNMVFDSTTITSDSSEKSTPETFEPNIGTVAMYVSPGSHTLKVQYMDESAGGSGLACVGAVLAIRMLIPPSIYMGAKQLQ